ncbi:MAG: tetratricopeptide repeat protein [Nostoc sp.]|uniref:tetratricopeptide repeat protein n=1 Tax=Nostoc sp. TaxID=1180 RepID=UPI002FFAFEAE
MRRRLFKQKRTKVNQVFTIAIFTTLTAISSISCSKNDNVLVTEIGVSQPSRSSATALKGGEFYLQGKNQHLNGDLQAAIASYGKAIAQNSQYGAAYNARGLVYFDLGDKEKAIADYNQALRINPNDAEAYNNLGNARASLGNNREAVKDYSEAIRLNPNYAEAYNNRGNAHAALGEKRGALDDFDQAILLNPKYAIAYNNRGNARAANGEPGAIEDYNQAIRLNSNFGAAYNNRGNARATSGDKQGALKDLQQAASIFQSQGNNDLYEQVMKNIKELGQ